VCSDCGRSEPRWLGRCPGCGAWSTLLEEAPPSDDARAGTPARAAAPGRIVELAEVALDAADRIVTGIPELDRVLGGGLVAGSLVLLGGEPGIGKSSLTAAMLARLAATRRVLLVTGEESPAQVRLRAERLGASSGVRVLAETELETVCATLEADAPEVVVVDSVQTLWASELGSAPGSVAQVREAASRLLRLAKQRRITVVLIGHVTKEGAVAGPRVLEHLVDVTLMFEGDGLRALRVLRAQKNRFGATDEVGLFEMTGAGLVSVDDAGLLYDRADADAPGSCAIVSIEGTRPLVLEVQALVAPSELALPRRLASGFDRNRLSLLLAVLARTARFGLAQHDVFVNVAGGVRVGEPAADLAVCLALASAACGLPLGPTCALGEVALTGRLRAVSQPERRLAEASRLGLGRVVAPEGTPDGPLRVLRAATLVEALRACGLRRPRPAYGSVGDADAVEPLSA
jgi:DNA repair protein RadA/Sms